MKIFDINVDEHKISNDKISINIKNVENDSISEMKCFRNLETIIFLEAKKINLIKISKTFFFNLPNLHHVDLRDNKLLKISENFQELKNLRSLKIDDNQISIIPNFLGNLDKLEIFTFSNNRIKNLPTSLQYLQKLKVLKFANNQISVIPIEFGLLKSLECLYMDANHFTEIPTTICYLKHLSELCFEWLEFLDPPFGKIIKDSMGRTIISIIRNSLQDMIKQNILYCDFLNFIQKNSNTCNVSSTSQLNCDNKNESKFLQKGQETNDKNVVSKEIVSNSTSLNIQGNQKKFMKIFYAIENNYYGVIKSLLDSNIEILAIKNADNKFPLYLAIHSNRIEITKLMLTKIDFNNVSSPHIYLHKAIRMREPILTEKLLNMGIDIDASDDQGATCFHVLFNCFTKNFHKCSLIGDILITRGCKLNVFNMDSWAPVHIAARRGSKECLLWIIEQNKNLTKLGKETFNLNLKGKNRWTPLHLSVNGFKIEETITLLQARCDVFAKNSDGKVPRKVSNGNYILTKLLKNYENFFIQQKYFNYKKENYNSNANNLFTTLEDNSNIDDYSSFIKNKKEEKEKFFATTEDKLAINSLKFNSYSDNNLKNKDNFFSIDHYSGNIAKTKTNGNPNIKNESQRSSNSIVSVDLPSEKMKNKKNLIGNIKTIQPNLKRKNNIPPSKIFNNKNLTEMKKYNSVSINCSGNIINSNNNSSPKKRINIHFQKEILINNESDLVDKYEALMNIKIATKFYQTYDIENVIKAVLEGLDLDFSNNVIIFCDFLSLIISNQYYDMIPFLELLQKSIKKKNMKLLLEKELQCTISILKHTQESFKKTTVISHFTQTNLNKNPLIKNTIEMKKENKQKPKEAKTLVTSSKDILKKDKYKTENLFLNHFKNLDHSPVKKKVDKKFETESFYNEDKIINKSKNNTGKTKSEENSGINLNLNNNVEIRTPNELESQNTMQINTSSFYNLRQNQVDESCNIADSSWSMAKAEDTMNEIYTTRNIYSNHSDYNTKTEDVKCDTMKPDDESFNLTPPKKIESSFIPKEKLFNNK